MSIAAPPSPQEISRKLSTHSISRRSPRPSHSTPGLVSGTESESDLSADTVTPMATPFSGSIIAQPHLSSIAERRSSAGEDSDEDEDDDGTGTGWRTPAHLKAQKEETQIKAGYLWKKGERRKTWKKRWFVLRRAHIAYYKTAAEYELLRLLDLSDVHSCTKVVLKRHDNTFGLISPSRTFYLQAKNPQEVEGWVRAIEEACEALKATESGGQTQPIPIPASPSRGRMRNSVQFGGTSAPALTPSPPSNYGPGSYMTSSDSDDASPIGQRAYSLSSQTRTSMSYGAPGSSPNAGSKMSAPADPSKALMAGYVMKCSSKRKNWKKRYFVLSSEQLMYFGSHMDTKPHRRFPFSEILDALEFDVATRGGSSSVSSPPPLLDGDHQEHTFKIVTTKRTLLICAPSEEDEIKWLGAVRALIARRAGGGGVPGEGQSVKQPTGHEVTASTGSGVSTKEKEGSTSGLITRVRRLSASANVSTGVPGDG